MATVIVPFNGKSGVIIFKSAHLYLEEWELALEIESEDFKHFEMSSDVNNLIFRQLLTGFAGGTATVRGKFDNTVGSYLPTDKSIWPDQSGTGGWLGYTNLVGFKVSHTVIGIRASQSANRPVGSLYEANLKITACTFSTTGP
jgi:hypothetical protein